MNAGARIGSAIGVPLPPTHRIWSMGPWPATRIACTCGFPSYSHSHSAPNANLYVSDRETPSFARRIDHIIRPEVSTRSPSGSAAPLARQRSGVLRSGSTAGASPRRSKSAGRTCFRGFNLPWVLHKRRGKHRQVTWHQSLLLLRMQATGPGFHHPLPIN